MVAAMSASVSQFAAVIESVSELRNDIFGVSTPVLLGGFGLLWVVIVSTPGVYGALRVV